MKKIFAIFAIVVMVSCFSGCDDEGTKAVEYSSSDDIIKPEMNVYGSSIYIEGMRYYYVVDEVTGVVYLECDGVRRHGITVAFNADGTVMTKDQIIKK